MRSYNLIGRKFGRLEVIEQEMPRRSKHDVYWICRCECGNEKAVTTGHLISGTVTSCGCLRKEQAIAKFKEAACGNIRHGGSATRLYKVWQCMVQRCTNPKNPAYRWYGAKGVKVCDEWRDYAVFSQWAYSHGFQDLKNPPRNQQLSIDRIDSNKDYCPENCRWITVSENTRRGSIARWENAKNADRIRRAESTI